jgi:hypothetical protein
MAGAGKKTFTAGETLTASDVNTYLMEQSVMVFGGTAARSSAIPTPSEGMTTYRTDTQQIESYDGSNWINMSGLQLIKSQVVGSGVASVTVTSCFNAAFANYRVLYVGGLGSAAGFTLNARGSSGTGSSVIYSGDYVDATGARTGLGATTTGFPFTLVGTSGITGAFDVTTPFTATITGYIGNGFAYSGGSFQNTRTGGIDTQTTSSTGLTITPGSGTLTGGTIYVYGYGV